MEEFPHLVDLNELELYKLFFDKEVKELFLDCTNKYALAQKNDPSFPMNTEDLWDFFTIITFASYNLRSQFTMYWSNEADISSPFVREIMSRNYFKKVKAYLHVCDNDKLSSEDKLAITSPLCCSKKNLIQFGVFAEHLSIDGQIANQFLLATKIGYYAQMMVIHL